MFFCHTLEFYHFILVIHKHHFSKEVKDMAQLTLAHGDLQNVWLCVSPKPLKA